MSPDSARERISARKRLASALIGLAIALLVSEGVIRALKVAPEVTPVEISTDYGGFEASDNPLLKYVPRPGSRYINSYGLRDREYPLEKPKGTYRILVVGDSIAYGVCNPREALRDEDVFAKLLERSLNARSFANYEKVEVINLAVSGYDTLQESEFLRIKGLPLRPDLVVVAYSLNDAWVNSAELGMFIQKAGGPEKFIPAPLWVSRAFGGSALARFVWQRVRILQDRMIDESARDIPMIGFRRIREMADRFRFKVLVAAFPVFGGLDHYEYQPAHQAVRIKAEKNGFRFLDLLGPFVSAANHQARAFQGRCENDHPDESGHRLAATELEKAILRAGLLGENHGPR